MKMHTTSNYPSTTESFYQKSLRKSTTTASTTQPHDDGFAAYGLAEHNSMNKTSRAGRKNSHHNMYRKADEDTTASSLEATCRNLEQALFSLEGLCEEEDEDDASIFDSSVYQNNTEEKPEHTFGRRNSPATDGSFLTTTTTQGTGSTAGSMTGISTPSSSVKAESPRNRQSPAACGISVVASEEVEKVDGSGELTEDAERKPSLLYKTKLCSYFKIGKCKRGGFCSYAHEENVLRPRPDLSKTQLCKNLVSLGRCHNGSSCPFAHSQADLKVVELSKGELESFQSNIEIKKMAKENASRGQSECDKETVVAQEVNAAVGNVGKNKTVSGKKKIVNKSMFRESVTPQEV